MLKSKKLIPVAKARVLFPFKAQNKDELSLKVNDVVNVLKKELPDEGWWLGEINGSIGVFPDNFVKILPEFEGEIAKNEVFKKDKKEIQKELVKNILNSSNDNQIKDTFDLDIDCIKPTSKKLTHITANRVKGPHKRLPSRFLAKAEGDNSSGSSVVSVVMNKRSETQVDRNKSPGLKSFNENLDSCWGNVQDSPESMGISPRLFSSDSPDSSQPLSVSKVKISKPYVHNGNNNSQKYNIKNQNVINKSRKGGVEGEAGDRIAGRFMGDILENGESGFQKVISMEEYESLIKEVDQLRKDIRDQAVTNERMVQTLKNFLNEEKMKVAKLARDFESIRSSVISDITFL